MPLDDRTLVITNLIGSLLCGGLAIPLICEKIPRNCWYGFRTRRSLSSDEMWYRMNKLGGQYLLVGAVVQLAMVLVLGALDPAAYRQVMGWSPVPMLPVIVALLLWAVRVRKF